MFGLLRLSIGAPSPLARIGPLRLVKRLFFAAECCTHGSDYAFVQISVDFRFSITISSKSKAVVPSLMHLKTAIAPEKSTLETLPAT